MAMRLEARQAERLRNLRDSAFDITLAARSPSEQRRAGGDFAEIIQRGDGGATVLVGDAAAKGDIGRHHAEFLVACFRVAAARSKQPNVILARMNAEYCRFLLSQPDGGSFATAAVASLFPSGLMLYGAAGAPPSLLFENDQNHEHVRPYGSALGIAQEQDYTSRCFQLTSGTVLLVFTDGVTESRSRNDSVELFGSRGVAQLAHHYLRHGHQLCAQTLLAEVSRRGFVLKDDATLLCCVVS